jgi:hypothetical protein
MKEVFHQARPYLNMNKIMLLMSLFLLSVPLRAQTNTLESLKKTKLVVLPDYVEIPESEIAYPVTGMVQLGIPTSLQGETIIEVEVWVIDARGRVVYNTVYAGKNLEKISFEPGYMKYMMSQGRAILRKRRVAGF